MLGVLLETTKNLLEKVITPMQAVLAAAVVGTAIVAGVINSNREATRKQKLADLRDQRIAQLVATAKLKEKPVQQKLHQPKPVVANDSHKSSATASASFSSTTSRMLPALGETQPKKARKNKIDELNAEYERLQVRNKIQQDRLQRIRNKGEELTPEATPALTPSRYNKRR
jgi:outer membrane murein-binding lipoprotein Lpp